MRVLQGTNEPQLEKISRKTRSMDVKVKSQKDHQHILHEIVDLIQESIQDFCSKRFVQFSLGIVFYICF